MKRAQGLAVMLLLVATTVSACAASRTDPSRAAGCPVREESAGALETCNTAQRALAETDAAFQDWVAGVRGAGAIDAARREHAAWEAGLPSSCANELSLQGGFPASEPEEFPSTADDYECLTSMHDLRARVLRERRRAVPGQPIEGVYVRPYWTGELRIEPAVEGVAAFSLGVFGRSAGGEIAGDLVLSSQGDAGVFEEDEEAGDPCRLEFLLTPTTIEVHEASRGCEGWRGAGTSFGGTYERAGSLDGESRGGGSE